MRGKTVVIILFTALENSLYYQVVGYQHLGDMLRSSDPAAARDYYTKITDQKKIVTYLERNKYQHILDNINSKIDMLPLKDNGAGKQKDTEAKQSASKATSK